ncbi:MAG: DUF2339 domain-containing protein, partial [Candidatus Omnitrophica bacterium]|nr:DUF2339 domain-containing protein [Candidatus Omnitrophota bacterium]
MFNKLGIFAVVLGVALFLGYSYQYLGPLVKLLIGYASGAGLLIAGIVLEKKKDISVYGKTLIAGGWAIIYFCTFAISHIPAVKIVNNMAEGITLLLVVSVLVVAHTYKYRSQLVTGFSYLLIFVSLMTAPPTLYTVAAVLVAAASLVFFMLRNSWNSFGAYGLMLTYISYIAVPRAVRTPMEFVASVAFLGICWAIFTFAVMRMKVEDKKDEAIRAFPRNIKDLTHILNVALVSLCVWLLITSSGMTRFIPHMLALGTALYLVLTVANRILGQRSLSMISSTAVIGFVSAWIFFRFSGVPLCLVFLMFVCLVSLAGTYFNEKYWRILSYIGYFKAILLLGQLTGGRAGGIIVPYGQWLTYLGWTLFYWVFSIVTSCLIKNDKKLDLGGEIAFGAREAMIIGNAIIFLLMVTYLLDSGYSYFDGPMMQLISGLYLIPTILAYRKKTRSVVVTASSFAIFSCAVWLDRTVSSAASPFAFFLFLQLVLLAGVVFKERYWRMIAYSGLFCVLLTLVMKMSGKHLFSDHIPEVRWFLYLGIMLLGGIFSTVNALLVNEVDPVKIRGTDLAIGVREIFLTVNAAILIYAGWYLLSLGYLSYKLSMLFLGMEAYFLISVLTRSKKERMLMIISSTVSVILASACLVTRYSGYPLTISFVVLTQVILACGILFREIYWRLLSGILLMAVLAKLVLLDPFMADSAGIFAGVSQRSLLLVGSFLIYLFNYVLYLRIRQRGMLSKIELWWPTFLSFAFPAIYALATWLDLPKALTAPAWGLIGGVLFHVGYVKRNIYQRWQGYALAAGGFLRLVLSNFLLVGGVSVFSYRLMTAVPVIFMLYYITLMLEEKAHGVELTIRENRMHIVLELMVFSGLMLLVRYECLSSYVGSAWAGISIVYLLKGYYSKKRVDYPIASFAVLCVLLRVLYFNIMYPVYMLGPDMGLAGPALAIALLYLGNVFCSVVGLHGITLASKVYQGRLRMILYTPRV